MVQYWTSFAENGRDGIEPDLSVREVRGGGYRLRAQAGLEARHQHLNPLFALVTGLEPARVEGGRRLRARFVGAHRARNRVPR